MTCDVPGCSTTIGLLPLSAKAETLRRFGIAVDRDAATFTATVCLYHWLLAVTELQARAGIRIDRTVSSKNATVYVDGQPIELAQVVGVDLKPMSPALARRLRSFKLRPIRPLRTHVRVVVADDHDDMRDAMAQASGWDRWSPSIRNSNASVIAPTPDQSSAWHPCVAVAFFDRSFLDEGVVAHELTHAAHRYVEYHAKQLPEIARYMLRSYPEPLRGEEMMCAIVESLTRGFYRAMRGMKLLP